MQGASYTTTSQQKPPHTVHRKNMLERGLRASDARNWKNIGKTIEFVPEKGKQIPEKLENCSKVGFGGHVPSLFFEQSSYFSAIFRLFLTEGKWQNQYPQSGKTYILNSYRIKSVSVSVSLDRINSKQIRTCKCKFGGCQFGVT